LARGIEDPAAERPGPPPPTAPATAGAGAGGDPPPQRYGTFASLAYRNYRLLWFGQASHAAALWMEQIARPWLVLIITNDNAAHVGGVVAMRTLPQLFFGVWAGVIADHFDRKTILLATKVGVFILNAVFAGILIAGMMELWMIYVATFIRGCFMAFDQPARQSMIASIVPREILTNGVALMSSTQNVMRIAGVIAAGALIAFLGIDLTFVVISVVILGAVVSTAMLDVPTNRDHTVKTTARGLTDSLVEGVRYALAIPSIRGVMLLSVVFYVFAMSWMQVFAPLFARTVMETGALGLSAITSVSAVGALVGTVYIAGAYPKALGRILPWSVVGMGAALVVFSALTYLPSWWGIILPMAAVTVVGFMQTAYVSLSNAALLSAAEDRIRGRVMSVLSLSRAMVSLGSAVAGFMAAAMGAQMAQIIFGLVAVAGGLAMFFFAKGFRDYRTD
jgi:MFS family permease